MQEGRALPARTPRAAAPGGCGGAWVADRGSPPPPPSLTGGQEGALHGPWTLSHVPSGRSLHLGLEPAAAHLPAGEEQAGAAEEEGREPCEGRLEGDRRRSRPDHGRPRATSPRTRAPSRGLAPCGPGTAPASRLAPKAASKAIGREDMAGGGEGAEEQGGDRRLVAGRQQQAVSQRRGPGIGRCGIRSGRTARRTSRPASTTAATPAARSAASARAARPRRRPRRPPGRCAPTNRSSATLATASARRRPLVVSRRTRHRSAPMSPGVKRPSSSDSAYARRCQRRPARPRTGPASAAGRGRTCPRSTAADPPASGAGSPRAASAASAPAPRARRRCRRP